MTDRFSSHEDIDYSRREYNQGSWARRDMKPQSKCPYLTREKRMAWMAGLCDKDIELIGIEVKE